jgi:hypothetical protein
MSAHESTARMLSLFDGEICIGFLFDRGRSGWESYDRDDRSRGTFQKLGDAAAAVAARRAAIALVST